MQYIALAMIWLKMHLLILRVVLTVSVYQIILSLVLRMLNINIGGGRRGRDRMVVGFTTTYAINVYHH
jgi:hypothetical protein